MIRIYPKLVLVLFLFCILFISCEKPDYQPSDARLDVTDLLLQCPDSARSLLASISPTELSPSDRMVYHLLLTQANDKCYIDHTDDSVMVEVVDYYERENVSDYLRMKSYYYLGRVYQDLDSASLGIKYLMMTRKLAKDLGDLEFVCLANSNLGNICNKHQLYEEAGEYYKKAQKAAELNNDSLRLAVILTNISNIYIERGPDYYEKARDIQLRAYHIIKNLNRPTVERMIVLSLAAAYSYVPDNEQAIYWSKQYINIQPYTQRHYSSYLVLGESYWRIGKVDSALHYLHKATLAPIHKVVRGSYMLLSEIARKQGALDEALRLNDSCLHYTRLVDESVRSGATMKNLKEAIFQELMAEKESVMRKQQLRTWSLFLVITCLLFYFIFRFIQYRRNLSSIKKEAMAMKLKLDEKRSKMIQLQTLISECENDKIHISYLEKQLDKVKSEQEFTFKNMLPLLPFYQKLTDVIKKREQARSSTAALTDKQWLKIISEFDTVSDLFSVRLSHQYPLLKNEDIYFCCLLKMGFNYTEISILFSRTKNMIYKRRNLVMERLGLDESCSLDDFIRLF